MYVTPLMRVCGSIRRMDHLCLITATSSITYMSAEGDSVAPTIRCHVHAEIACSLLPKRRLCACVCLGVLWKGALLTPRPSHTGADRFFCGQIQFGLPRVVVSPRLRRGTQVTTLKSVTRNNFQNKKDLVPDTGLRASGFPPPAPASSWPRVIFDLSFDGENPSADTSHGSQPMYAII